MCLACACTYTPLCRSSVRPHIHSSLCQGGGGAEISGPGSAAGGGGEEGQGVHAGGEAEGQVGKGGGAGAAAQVDGVGA